MATYTSYLNLKKPTTSENYSVLDWNNNMDKIDAGVSALNSNLGDLRGTRFPVTNYSSVAALYAAISQTGNNNIGIYATNASTSGDLGAGSDTGIVLAKYFTSDSTVKYLAIGSVISVGRIASDGTLNNVKRIPAAAWETV